MTTIKNGIIRSVYTDELGRLEKFINTNTGFEGWNEYLPNSKLLHCRTNCPQEVTNTYNPNGYILSSEDKNLTTWMYMRMTSSCNSYTIFSDGREVSMTHIKKSQNAP